MGFVKGIIRTGVIVALGGGAAALVAETASPGSVAAIAGQARSAVAGLLASAVEDPVALRAQLKTLEAEYPARIASVRADLAEVEDQIAQLDRDLAVSERVVALTARDLGLLDDGIAQARAAEASSPHAVVRISFEQRNLDLTRAFGRRAEIEQTQKIYQNRAEEIGAELTFLDEQRGQLAELLAQLETERAEFQAQIVQLDAQIDAIARSERMIAMMEHRQERIDELSRHEVHSLDQFRQRVAKLRGEQQARMESLGRDRKTRDYEDEARWELDQTGVDAPVRPAPASDQVIQIRPASSSDDQVAAAGR